MNVYQQAIARMFIALTWALVAHRGHAAVWEDSIRAAIAEHLATVPEEEIPYTYYLSLLPAEGDEQRDLERAIKLMIASTSRQQVLEYCVPQRLGAAPVLVVNVRHLEWDYNDWRKVVGSYPYSHYNNPQLIRADWLLNELADGRESQAYRRLLFGGKNLDKSRDKLLKLMGAQQIDDLTWGYVEGESGVAVNGTRLISSLPTFARTSAWGTRDVLELTTDKDPIENPDGDFKHDGEEWIFPLPKVSETTGRRGWLQGYFLADAKGKIVDAAPIGLVRDKTELFGTPELVAPGSCFSCHREGTNLPTKNESQELRQHGVQLFSDNQIELKRFYGSGLIPEMTAYNEGYATAIFETCDLKVGEGIDTVADSFRRAIARYDRPLDILDTAKELNEPPVDWQATIETAGVHLDDDETELPARIAGLAQGLKISRDAWEPLFNKAYELAKE